MEKLDVDKIIKKYRKEYPNFLFGWKTAICQKCKKQRYVFLNATHQHEKRVNDLDRKLGNVWVQIFATPLLLLFYIITLFYCIRNDKVKRKVREKTRDYCSKHSCCLSKKELST